MLHADQVSPTRALETPDRANAREPQRHSTQLADTDRPPAGMFGAMLAGGAAPPDVWLTPLRIRLLQRHVGNRRVAQIVSRVSERPKAPSRVPVQSIAEPRPQAVQPAVHLGDAITSEHHHALPRHTSAGRVVQRSFLGDLWDAGVEAGAAVANAMRLVAALATNPAQLPVVLAAITWQLIPERFKGPVIDTILRASLALARAVELPGPPGLSIATILKHAV